MAIRIICPPGPNGGVITGWLEPQTAPPTSMKIAVFQSVSRGWVACKSALQPARLWSGRVKPPVAQAAPEWMVMLVSKNYDLKDFDVSRQSLFEYNQADASPLEITNGGTGDAKLLTGRTSATPHEHHMVLPFLWRRNGSAGGWVFVGTKPLRPRKDGSWSTLRDGGAQHAVLLVDADEELDPTSMTPADVPKNAQGRHNMALTSTIDIVVLGDTHRELSGVVTGLTQVSTLGGFPDGEDHLHDAPLVIYAWDEGAQTIIGPATCGLEGSWTLAVPPRHGPLVVAVTTDRFGPTTEAPGNKGGEVIAVTRVERERLSQS